MNLQDKCEWIHSQIQEVERGIEVDFEMMLSYLEDIREHFLRGN